MSARGPAADHPTRWVLLPFLREERSRRVLHLPRSPQMKIYNLYETITAEYWKFQKQPKNVKYPFEFLKTIFSSSFPVRMLWDGGCRCRRGRGGIPDVNEETEAEIWGSYCFVSNVKYEKELKGRRLKRGACGVCKWNMFQSHHLQPLLLFRRLSEVFPLASVAL